MFKPTLIPLVAIAALGAIVSLSGCDNAASVASHNLSKEADNFGLNRRVVFYNGIGGEYILSIQGACNIVADRQDNQLEVTCKVGTGYKKHFLGLSDNVTYFVEQLEPVAVGTENYQVSFKPSVIVPDIRMR